MPYNVVRLGGETRINALTDGIHWYPSWISLPDGRLVMQWVVGEISEGGPYGLFQQIFDANGHKIGNETRIYEAATGTITDSLSVTLAGGRWGAIWRVQAPQPSTDIDFYFQSFDTDGAARQRLSINETPGGATNAWNHLFLRNGNSIHLWTGRSTKQDQADDAGVFFTLIDASGNILKKEIRVNAAVSGRDEHQGTYIALTDGGWVVTYRAINLSGAIWQQAFNPDGTKRGGEVKLTSDGSADSGGATLRSLADGKWMTSWYEGTNSINRDLYYQIFNPNGSSGGRALVTTSTDGAQTRIASHAMADGGFVIHWRGKGDQSGQTDDSGLFYQRFDVNGAKVGGETRLNTTVDGEQAFSRLFSTAKLAADGSTSVVDRYVMFWKGKGTQPGQDDDAGLFFQMIDAMTGLKVGGETRVTTSTNGEAPDNYEAARLTSSGNFIVAWSGEGTQPGQTDNAGVFMQMFDRNGTKIGTETRVNTKTDGSQELTAVRELPNGSWVVAWRGPDDGGDSGVFLQVFDRNGNRVGGEMTVNSSTTGIQESGYVDVLPDGTLLVGWGGVGDQPGQEDAGNGQFFQRFRINASPESIAISGSIQETAAMGTTAGTLSTVDLDRNDTHTFTLVDAANAPTAHQLFEISGSTIKLKAGAKLDYEAATSHNLRVKVTDAFGGSYVQEVSVNVTNVREKTPLRKNGTAGADILFGELGNDTLSGGSGDDRLNGDLGRDRISTGSGKDVVIFDQRASSSNRDTITDFDPRRDSLYFDNAFFTKLGKKGSLEKPAKLSKTYLEFSAPNDGNDYLIYNRKTGALSYDADGNKAGKAIEIAIFTNKPKFTISDFFVI
jgi:Ca2+-binding RTX toxin-like protein